MTQPSIGHSPFMEKIGSHRERALPPASRREGCGFATHAYRDRAKTLNDPNRSPVPALPWRGFAIKLLSERAVHSGGRVRTGVAARARPDPTRLRCAPEAREAARSPTPTPGRRWDRSPSSGCIPILERRPKASGPRRPARSYRDSLITPFDGLRPRAGPALCTSTSKIKKPTWWNTQRYSATPAYSSTSPPAKPGCPLSSHPTTLIQVFNGPVCESTRAPLTTYCPAPNGKASEFLCDLLCHGSVRSSEAAAFSGRRP